MIIGVTGRAGSGKTFFEHYVRQITTATCIDLDAVGHEALQDAEIQTRLTDRFGESIVGSDGIDRKALGSIVFNDANELKALNAIMHPKMNAMVMERLNSQGDTFIFGALINEMGLTQNCDYIVTLDASDDVIQQYSARQYAIAQRQRPRDSYIQEANFVIENTFDGRFLDEIHRLLKNTFRITTTLDRIDAQEE